MTAPVKWLFLHFANVCVHYCGLFQVELTPVACWIVPCCDQARVVHCPVLQAALCSHATNATTSRSLPSLPLFVGLNRITPEIVHSFPCPQEQHHSCGSALLQDAPSIGMQEQTQACFHAAGLMGQAQRRIGLERQETVALLWGAEHHARWQVWLCQQCHPCPHAEHVLLDAAERHSDFEGVHCASVSLALKAQAAVLPPASAPLVQHPAAAAPLLHKPALQLLVHPLHPSATGQGCDTASLLSARPAQHANRWS
jgi:hypothetical protein